ncbi:MAG: hypothetical protein SFY92_10130, partial [Verrucomicrobiae bacterium]|nr:hypothetical protein [Verrucomicrobiae bacterium]
MKTQSLSLNGTWQASWNDGVRGLAWTGPLPAGPDSRLIPVRVPGDLHDDLLRAKLISEPHEGTNTRDCRWVSETMWFYRRTFTAPVGALDSRAWLFFEKLDLVARIFLNGTEIGSHANYFRPCRIDVTGKLRKGKNLLVVQIESGLFHASEKPAEGWMSQGIDQRLHKRHWLRKPQFQFGWDWSPRLIQVGIHGDVCLEYTDSPVRVEQFAPLASLDDSLDSGSVRGRFVIEGLHAQPVPCALSLSCGGLGKSETFLIKPGLHTYDVILPVPKPKLWWPVGHGAQSLYKIRGTVTLHGMEVFSSSREVGFRKVRFRQDPSPLPRDNAGLQGIDTVRTPRNYRPEKGRTFILEINDRPVFCKGANYVPADMMLTRITREHYRQLVDRALEANFNLLRVWGGGLYESEDFYDLCNRKGLLVWQDFAYACSKYPSNDPVFLENITLEATWQVRRLAPHPSLVIWCGNNEMEWVSQWAENPANGEKHVDYGLFHFVLPQVLRQEDGTRHYQPSSPYSPEGLFANADEAGDQHPWCVGFHNLNFHDYRRLECRFANEGGFLGPNSLASVRTSLGPDTRIGGSTWVARDNSIAHMGAPAYTDTAPELWLGKKIRDFSLEEYVYWTGLLHGEALSEYIHNFRWRMFSSAAAVFWMYNDCWDTPRSWTIVDHLHHRTPAFHPVRRAYAPVHVIVTHQAGEVVIHGVNETRQAVEATLRYGLFGLTGGFPVDERIPALLPPNASTPLARFPISWWKSPRDSAAFAH